MYIVYLNNPFCFLWGSAEATEIDKLSGLICESPQALWKIDMQRQKFYRFLIHERKRRESMELDLQLRLKQQEAVASFGEFAISARNLNELFEQCVRVLTDVLQVDFAKILELDTVHEVLLLRAGTGWHPGLIGQATISSGIDSPAGYTLLYEEPIIVTNLNEDARFTNPSLLKGHHAVSGMSIAIIGREHPFGVLGVYTTTARKFTSYDARFLKSIANILASFIERTRVETELRNSHNELSTILNGVAEAVTVLNPDGQMIYANQAAARMLGYPTRETLLQTSRAEMMAKFVILDEHGETVSPETLPSRRALKGEKAPSQKIRFRILETGEERWSIIDSMPVFDASGAVIMAVNIFRDITDIIHEEQMQQLLAEAGDLLTSSLDYKTTLANLAELSVTYLSDWCVVHIITEDQQIQQLSVSHKDPQKLQLALEYHQKYPPDWEKSTSLTKVLRTGKAAYFPEITDEMLQATAIDAEQLEMMRTLGLKSAMLVPLTAHERILGAISLVWAESGRRYTQDEVAIVQELARRAANAIENAQLYHQTQVLNSELEQRVAQRTKQLEQANRLLKEENEERMRTVHALQNSETMLNSLFESAPDATILTNSEGKIIRVNRQAESLFGYPRHEMLGESIQLLIPTRYHVSHQKYQMGFLRKATARTMGIGRHLYACRKDGTEFNVDIMLSPLQTDEEVLVISSIRNITEQKRLQAELAETHQRLMESIEAERTSLARELHDGPMQDLYGISWNYELLKSSSPSGESQVLIDSAQATILTVIDTLREICGELRPHALDHLGFDKAIHSHVTKLRETHPNIEIKVKLLDNGKLLSDRAKLAIYRVYQNALSNIVRHAEARKVTVTFRRRGQNAYLEIQDDGRGFAIPNRWVELARSGHFGLVGMIERMHAIGGSMEVISSPGEGTTIKVIAPLSTAEYTAAKPSDNGYGRLSGWMDELTGEDPAGRLVDG
jgi:PAS domain S-box-containing protein